MTPVLRKSHWLPVRQRIRFKTAVMVYKCIHDLAPSHLASYCKPTSSCPGRSHLRSATSGQLNFRHTKIDYGKRSFDVNGSVVSNSLPTELRSPDISLDVFKARLKTFLFNLIPKMSVRPSVCLYVRLSHAGILSKRLHISLNFFHRWVNTKGHGNIPTGTP